MKKLKEIVDKVKPKVHVFGHIHEANGVFFLFKKVIN